MGAQGPLSLVFSGAAGCSGHNFTRHALKPAFFAVHTIPCETLVVFFEAKIRCQEDVVKFLRSLPAHTAQSLRLDKAIIVVI